MLASKISFGSDWKSSKGSLKEATAILEPSVTAKNRPSSVKANFSMPLAFLELVLIPILLKLSLLYLSVGST